MSPDEFRGFWISTVLRYGKLELKLGKAGDINALMTGVDDAPVEIRDLGLASWPDVLASYKNVGPGKKKFFYSILLFPFFVFQWKEVL